MEAPATPPPTMTTRAALIGGASRRGDHDAVVGCEGQRHRLLALEPHARGVGRVHPQRPAVDRHLEPHEGPEERDDLEHAVESVPSVLRRALSDDGELLGPERDRKSTRLNSSHLVISYAVFCLKKKTTTKNKC